MNREDQLLNRSEIIRMAREAGMEQDGDNFFSPSHEEIDVHITDLERFAALIASRVAAAERKAMMQLFTDPENQPTQHGTVTVDYMQREIAAERNSWPAEMEAMERQVNILTDALAQAKAEEREACAKVCEEIAISGENNDNWTITRDKAFHDCAAAIRARGEKK